jgi:hypothetical protein
MNFRPNPPLLNSDPDAASAGGGVDATLDTGASTAPANTGAPATAPDTAPKPTMLEAMFGQKQAEPTAAEAVEAAAKGVSVQQLRDEKGRFAGKAPDGQPQVPAVDPKKPPDPNQMPEGLAPKAQERFQALANSNKELTAKVAEYQPIVESALGLQEVFQTNGIRREQFEHAMQVVGLMNRGDLDGALRALDEQRRLISLALGRPLPGVDALAQHPDLRAEVDNLQMAEERALEIARARAGEQQRQQAQQRQQQENQRTQQEQQEQRQQQQSVQTGQLAVDKFCKARMADDLDYARIEPMLLKEIQGGLLEGVHPQRWASLIEKTYGLIKQTASATRASGHTATVLRPTGGESPRQAPKTMHEAMWGGNRG